MVFTNSMLRNCPTTSFINIDTPADESVLAELRKLTSIVDVRQVAL